MIPKIGMTRLQIIHFEPFQKLLFWFKGNIYFFIRVKKKFACTKINTREKK